jgi:hypothetical protein
MEASKINTQEAYHNTEITISIEHFFALRHLHKHFPCTPATSQQGSK